MALTKCSDCGHDVSTRAAACPNCGAPVDPVCEDCGTQVHPNIAACPNCGAPSPDPLPQPDEDTASPDPAATEALFAALKARAPMATTRAHALLLAPLLRDPAEIVHVERGAGFRAVTLCVITIRGIYLVHEGNFAAEHLPAVEIAESKVRSRAFGGKNIELTLRDGSSFELPLGADPTRTVIAIKQVIDPDWASDGGR